MYQAPLTPEEEDEFVYNYLTEKRLGGEIQDGCKNESIYSRRFENSVIGMGLTQPLKVQYSKWNWIFRTGRRPFVSFDIFSRATWCRKRQPQFKQCYLIWVNHSIAILKSLDWHYCIYYLTGRRFWSLFLVVKHTTIDDLAHIPTIFVNLVDTTPSAVMFELK